MTNKSMCKRSRPGDERAVVAKENMLKRFTRERSVVVRKMKFDDEFQTIALMNAYSPATTSAATSSVTQVIDVVPSTSDVPADPTPEQAWNTDNNGVIRAMKSVVRTSEVAVTVDIMSDRIEGEYHLANSKGFTMQEFVEAICVKRDVLRRSGLEFANGVFSSNM